MGIKNTQNSLILTSLINDGDKMTKMLEVKNEQYSRFPLYTWLGICSTLQNILETIFFTHIEYASI